jgi:hypothetical protein
VATAVALAAPAAAPASSTHDLRGDWLVCGPSAVGPCSAAEQTWTITSMDLASGQFSGHGGGTGSNTLTFSMTGTATGDSFDMNNSHNEISYSAHWTGTIAADNDSMSGTWQDSGGQTGSWYAQRTSGPPGGGGDNSGDGDGDGIPDSSDACPDRPGTNASMVAQTAVGPARRATARSAPTRTSLRMH